MREGELLELVQDHPASIHGCDTGGGAVRSVKIPSTRPSKFRLLATRQPRIRFTGMHLDLTEKSKDMLLAIAGILRLRGSLHWRRRGVASEHRRSVR